MSDGSTATEHFGFPLLPANSSQPEVFVNEALVGIDAELYTLSTRSGSGGGSSSEVSSDTTAVLPPGGTTGQVLTKLSSTDGDAGWETPASGGGTSEVSSDNAGPLPIEVRVASFVGGSMAITTATNDVPIVIANDCVIEKVVTLGLGGAGSCVIDIYHGNFAAFPPTTSICASDKPTIASAHSSEDSTLTGWTTALTAGDILLVHLVSTSTFTAVQLALHLRITA